MAILPSWWSDVAPAWLGGSDISDFADPGADAFARAGLDSSGNAAGAGGAADSSGNLVQALQALSKADFAKQPDSTPLGAAKPTEVPAGRPRQVGSLDALVKLLQQRQAQYGTLSGQPVAQPRTLGLLGM